VSFQPLIRSMIQPRQHAAAAYALAHSFPGISFRRLGSQRWRRVLESYLPTPQNSGVANNFANSYANGSSTDNYLAKVDAAITKEPCYVMFQRCVNSRFGLVVLPLPYTSSRTWREHVLCRSGKRYSDDRLMQCIGPSIRADLKRS